MSFRYPEQISLAAEVAQSFAVDNGAFSAWKAGKPVTDWIDYYRWIEKIRKFPNFDFAVIPDVIDGTESDNDKLLQEWPFVDRESWIGAPVWHLHESIERLSSLASFYPRICFGSSGQFAQIGTHSWWNRMAEAMNAICGKDGRPLCKLHGLRMLDPRVFTKFPFASADSTNIARNVGLDSHWNGSYSPPNKEARAQVMRERIEAFQAACIWERKSVQISLTEGMF